MKTRLSNYVAKFMTDHGIDTCFTITGGGAMYLNDSFGHHPGLKCIYNHHEQASAMAAEGYARLNNKAALVCVTTGPGGTNALTGVLGAYLDSIPMMVISGQVRYDTTSRYAETLNGYKLRSLGDQEFDITSSLDHFTKYSMMIDDPKTIRHELEKAYHIMYDGRPGPVWIDIPSNIQSAMIETDELEGYEIETAKNTVGEDTINEVIDIINNASRPVLYPGNGIRCANAYDSFKNLIRKLNIPVCTYWDAIDLIETDDPLYVGRAGNMGDRPGNFAIENADVLLVIGNRLSIRNVGYNYKKWAENAYVIMVDIDEAELNKHTNHVDKKICCDAKVFINSLNDRITDTLFKDQKWIDKCNEWKNRYPVVEKKHYEDDEMNVYAAFDLLSKNIKDDSITVSSNGTCCVVGHQTWNIRGSMRFIHNNAIASMGYGLPAAIGACMANDRHEIICLEGDGSIMMNLQELQTIVTNRLPIKIFLINNEGYHSIRQTQENIFKEHSKVGIGPESNDLSFPEYKKIADAFGIPYYSCNDINKLKETIDEVMNNETYTLCELFVSKKQFFEPKNSARIKENGEIYSPPLYDLYPFLDEDELKEIMSVSNHQS